MKIFFSVGKILFALLLTASVASADSISNYAGGGNGNGGPAVSSIVHPYALSLGSDDTLFMADWDSKQVRAVAPGPNPLIQLVVPTVGNVLGVVVDAVGDIYFSEPSQIVMIHGGTGVREVFAPASGPSKLKIHNGFLYAALADSNTNQVVKFDLTTRAMTVVINASKVSNSSGDGGPAIQATIRHPMGIDFDGDVLYVTDTDGQKIRKVDEQGIITTVAGGGNTVGDGGRATSARLSFPSDVLIVDHEIFIADFGQMRIRKVDTNGIITTVAGTGTEQGSSSIPTQQAIVQPTCLAVDARKNIYIGSQSQGHVFILTLTGPTPTLTTIASTSTPSFTLRPAPTVTGTATLTFAPLPSPTLTYSPRPTSTSIITRTLTPTETGTTTAIPTWTATATNTGTPMDTPTATAVPGPILICDVTGNGFISSLDASYVFQKVVGLRTLETRQILAADATGDGKVSALDGQRILRYAAGYRDPDSRCGQIIFP